LLSQRYKANLKLQYNIISTPTTSGNGVLPSPISKPVIQDEGAQRTFNTVLILQNSLLRFLSLPGCTRSLQLSRVSIGLPLLQLAAEPFVTSYFTGRPVQPRPKRWDARTNKGVRQLSRGPTRWLAPIVAGRPVQPRPMWWGARISCGSASSAAGLRGGGPGTSNLRHLRVVRSSDGLDSPGRSAQPRWTLQGTATRRAASSTAGLRGAVRMRWA
jgi:hypothetical protein